MTDAIDNVDEVNAKLDALKQKYARRLADRVEVIDAAWRDLKESGSEDVAELIRLAHQMAGSAGMYDQAELGQMAATLEEKLEAYSKDSSMDAAEIDRLIGEMAALSLATRAAFNDSP